jgi:hypothetical protein
MEVFHLNDIVTNLTAKKMDKTKWQLRDNVRGGKQE